MSGRYRRSRLTRSGDASGTRGRGDAETRRRQDVVILKHFDFLRLYYPLFFLFNHRDELRDYDIVARIQFVEIFLFYVSRCQRKLEPNTRFFRLSFAITEFTLECFGIAPFSPCFGNIGTNGTRRSSNLINYRKFFFSRKVFGYLRNSHSQVKASSINSQVAVTSNVCHVCSPYS